VPFGHVFNAFDEGTDSLVISNPTFGTSYLLNFFYSPFPRFLSSFLPTANCQLPTGNWQLATGNRPPADESKR
jgi:hypothetical protein